MSADSKSSNKQDFTLVGPPAMGGIIASAGFDFQTRYILCRLAGWIADPAFRQIWPEGTGDVDIRFQENGQERREHIQVKDHTVTPSEFRNVVATFAGYDRTMPGAYQRFVLAAPDLSSELKPLKAWLERLRGATGFFDTSPDALKPSWEKVNRKINVLGLAEHAELVRGRLEFDVNLHNCHSNERTRDVLLAGMVKGKEEIWRNLDQAHTHVYDRLFGEISNRSGKLFGREEIEAILERLSHEVVISVRQPPLATIGVHNWAYEKITPAPDYEVNWADRFDRLQKWVPSATEWDHELIPELYRVRKALLEDKGSGLVQVMGSGCLSTQVALGLAFREIEGWVIETVQRPANQAWRSDAALTPNYVLQVRETLRDPDGDALALLVSVKNDVQQDVETFLTRTGISLRAVINVLPPAGAGSISIRSNGDAVALAVATRDALRAAQDKYGVKTTHLFMSGPQSVALFLGQRLTSMGRIQLYEYQDPGYVPSCLLRT